MTKRELLEIFHSLLPVMNDEETMEITKVLLKTTNRATLNGELHLVEEEPNK